MNTSTDALPHAGNLDVFLDDVEELLSRVMNIDDARIITLRQRITDSMDAARASANNTGTGLQSRTWLTTWTAETHVHRNPWTALGVVAAVGVIGLLMSRR